ncbi:type-1 angiotensin II receptor B-like [Clytia hemisphaerica]|eukprot:TCONS_00064217-protein
MTFQNNSSLLKKYQPLSASGGTQQSLAMEVTYLPSEILNIIALVIPCLLGTFGNLLVTYVFMWKKRRMRKPFESLLSILAVVDMFASMVVPVLFIYGAITKYRRWHFGYIGCKMISSFFPISVTLSQGILVLISYERYKSIKAPFERSLRQSFILVWMLITFVIGLILVSPYVYVLELVTSDQYGINTCIPSEKETSIMLLYSIGNVIRDFGATFVMITLGRMSNNVLKRSNTQLNADMTQFTDGPRCRNMEKARKMLIVVVIVFSTCVIPLDVFQFIVYILYHVGVTFSKRAYETVLTFNSVLSVLQIMNSATNVVIYSRMHKDFTRSLFSNARKTLRNFSQIVREFRMSDQKKEQSTELLDLSL